jgi:EamA domain-containing membrane protein RarD
MMKRWIIILAILLALGVGILLWSVMGAIIVAVCTALVFAIYTICKGRKNKKRALEKMTIQDLE